MSFFPRTTLAFEERRASINRSTRRKTPGTGMDSENGERDKKRARDDKCVDGTFVRPSVRLFVRSLVERRKMSSVFMSERRESFS